MRSLQFIALSGGGWLLDMALFTFCVAVFGLQPGVANLLSATTAAMTVYVVSRRFVFQARGFDMKAFIVYLAYTEVNIVVWAAAIQWLAGVATYRLHYDATTAALIAKIAVTPLSLLCNFIVARALSLRKKS